MFHARVLLSINLFTVVIIIIIIVIIIIITIVVIVIIILVVIIINIIIVLILILIIVIIIIFQHLKFHKQKTRVSSADGVRYQGNRNLATYPAGVRWAVAKRSEVKRPPVTKVRIGRRPYSLKPLIIFSHLLIQFKKFTNINSFITGR